MTEKWYYLFQIIYDATIKSNTFITTYKSIYKFELSNSLLSYTLFISSIFSTDEIKNGTQVFFFEGLHYNFQLFSRKPSIVRNKA